MQKCIYIEEKVLIFPVRCWWKVTTSHCTGKKDSSICSLHSKDISKMLLAMTAKRSCNFPHFGWWKHKLAKQTQMKRNERWTFISYRLIHSYVAFKLLLMRHFICPHERILSFHLGGLLYVQCLVDIVSVLHGCGVHYTAIPRW